MAANTIRDTFLASQRRSVDPKLAAIADNCRFDERISDNRWREYDSILNRVVADSSELSWNHWLIAYQFYLDEYYEVSPDNTPNAFLPINQSAWLQGFSENQTLVRLEDIRQILSKASLSLEELKNWQVRVAQGDEDANIGIRYFFELWNRNRDGRPMFGAFYDEVQQEADHDEWPTAIRNRLGLGHFVPETDGTIAVALMRYPMSEVLASGLSLDRSVCSVPTVLDGGMNEFFFPVPEQHPYGATMHLDPDHSDTLTSEVLHTRIEYRPEHIYRLGSITQSHSLSGESLVKSRDQHLRALRAACNRDDFGELLEGRT